jgi:hypothetical protein
MRHRIIVPDAPSDVIPRGAAVIATPAGLRVGADVLQPFGERCALALTQGLLVPARAAGQADRVDRVSEVGEFDDRTGRAVLSRRGQVELASWLGRPVQPSDLQARTRSAGSGSPARPRTPEEPLAEPYELGE